MKISVIMIDGGFRENVYAAQCFSEQTFPDNEYEILWIEFYDKPHSTLRSLKKPNIICLNSTGLYHSSYCFNRGIVEAKGELLVIPDADQVVPPDFLERVWRCHSQYENLVVYGYRLDEKVPGSLNSFSIEELKSKCVLKNPLNYGGCLTVRKKWLLEINGYEMHPLFASGYHANGRDIYTRFKNLGLAIQWNPELQLYHPHHPFSLTSSPRYALQQKLIDWRMSHRTHLTLKGIDSTMNHSPSAELMQLLQMWEKELDAFNEQEIQKGVTPKGKLRQMVEMKVSILTLLKKWGIYSD